MTRHELEHISKKSLRYYKGHGYVAEIDDLTGALEDIADYEAEEMDELADQYSYDFALYKHNGSRLDIRVDNPYGIELVKSFLKDYKKWVKRQLARNRKAFKDL